MAVAALLGLQSFFTSGAWTVIPLKYWIRNSADDYMVSSWRTDALKRNPPKQPLVVMLAGSSGREAIWSGPSLAAQVKADGGPSIVASNLSSSRQAIGQSLAIVDNLPSTSSTTVLVGINLTRMYDPPSISLQQIVGRKLLLQSNTLRQFAISHFGTYKHSYTILPGLLDSLATWLAAYSAQLLSGHLEPIQYITHPVDTRSQMNPKRLRRLRKWAASEELNGETKKNFSVVLSLLDELIKRSKERGFNVVFVDLPQNPGITSPGLKKLRAYYQPSVHALAAKYGIPYLDFNKQLKLTVNDFYDFSHIRAIGRNLWQAELSKELVRLYRSGVIPGGKVGQK